jgi:tRNA-binding protein
MGDDLQRLGLLVGRILAAEDHPGARAPSYLLTVDLGPEGTREALSS